MTGKIEFIFLLKQNTLQKMNITMNNEGNRTCGKLLHKSSYGKATYSKSLLPNKEHLQNVGL